MTRAFQTITMCNYHAVCRARSVIAVLLCLLFVSSYRPVLAAGMETVLQRGSVVCGVNDDRTGFSKANSLGEFSGMDVDVCRAVASAVFNDPAAVEFVVLTDENRFPALSSDEVDVLVGSTTWTMSNNTRFGEFVGVSYYDGQGFMAKRRSGLRSALELDNVTVCLREGSSNELNAIDFYLVNNLRYRPVYFASDAAAASAYEAEECGVLSSARSALAAYRVDLQDPDAHIVLPEIISKEPIGPVVAAGDSTWTNTVRWSLNCMINAEELGLSSATLQVAQRRGSPAVKRLLGLEGSFGDFADLDSTWCANIIRHVGNYAEVYERNIGTETVLGLERGINNLWTNEGLLYAPPIR